MIDGRMDDMIVGYSFFLIADARSRHHPTPEQNKL
jgi:hypothetical protein